MKVLKRIKNMLWSTGENETYILPEENSDFKLYYNDLIIGKLSFSKGEWFFEYTDEFKKQDEISPLVNFPNKEKVYRSENLWPFFASRIPSAAQLQKERNDEDVISLLKKYGQRSISNPYVLI